MTYNKTILGGRMTADYSGPERDGQPGKFRMAVDNPHSKKGEVLFIDVKVWGENLNKACKLMGRKGCKVLVDGRLTSREYEKEEYPGAKFHYASVSADTIQFCDNKPEDAVDVVEDNKTVKF